MKSAFIVLFIFFSVSCSYSQQKPKVLLIRLDFRQCDQCKDLGMLDSLFSTHKLVFSKPIAASILSFPARLATTRSKYSYTLNGIVKSNGKNCLIEYYFTDSLAQRIQLPNGKFTAPVANINQWKNWVNSVIADVIYYSRKRKIKDRMGVMAMECTISDNVCRFHAQEAFRGIIDEMNAHPLFNDQFKFEAATESHVQHLATFVRQDSIIGSMYLQERNPAVGKVFFNCSKPKSSKDDFILALWKSFRPDR